jgi:hypothetical protein
MQYFLLLHVSVSLTVILRELYGKTEDLLRYNISQNPRGSFYQQECRNEIWITFVIHFGKLDILV